MLNYIIDSEGCMGARKMLAEGMSEYTTAELPLQPIWERNCGQWWGKWYHYFIYGLPAESALLSHPAVRSFFPGLFQATVLCC